MFIITFLAVATMFAAPVGGHVSVAAIEAAPAAVATTPADEPVASTPPVETRPAITANDFIPEDRDLTSCIGVLERPGCGSESRGGWRQTMILGAMFVGLVVVFGNVARGVRRNRPPSPD